MRKECNLNLSCVRLFSLLRTDIKMMTKSHHSKLSKTLICKYLHAAVLVLSTLVNWEMWIEIKVYGGNDFDDYFDACERVQNMLSMTIRDEVFDTPNLSKTFLKLNSLINRIDSFNDNWTNLFRDDGMKKTRFFTAQALKMYSTYADKLKTKFNILDQIDSDDDDEDKEDEEENEIVEVKTKSKPLDEKEIVMAKIEEENTVDVENSSKVKECLKKEVKAKIVKNKQKRSIESDESFNVNNNKKSCK